jgi:hypothetical protein
MDSATPSLPQRSRFNRLNQNHMIKSPSFGKRFCTRVSTRRLWRPADGQSCRRETLFIGYAQKNCSRHRPLRLRSIVQKLELDGVDLRSAEDMSAALSRSHRATPRVLLDYLYEDEIKEFVSGSGIPNREKAQAFELVASPRVAITVGPCRRSSPEAKREEGPIDSQ